MPVFLIKILLIFAFLLATSSAGLWDEKFGFRARDDFVGYACWVDTLEIYVFRRQSIIIALILLVGSDYQTSFALKGKWFNFIFLDVTDMYDEVTQYSSDITLSGLTRSFYAYDVFAAPGAGKFVIYGTAFVSNSETLVLGTISNESSKLERLVYLSSSSGITLNYYGLSDAAVSL